MAKIPKTIYIDPEVIQKVEEIAAIEDRTFSHMADKLLRYAADNYTPPQKVEPSL